MSNGWPSRETLAVAIIAVLCTVLSITCLSHKSELTSSVRPNRRVVIFECPGGTDKGPNGHRVDTAPLLVAFSDAGFEAESMFFTDVNSSSLLLNLIAPERKPLAFISRVDPGIYEDCTMSRYYEFLHALANAGVAAFNHPDDMEALGQKRSLLRLQGMSIFVNDTHLYAFETGLPTLSEGLFGSLRRSGSRVIKQNRGSKGEGVLWVSLQDAENWQNNVSSATLVQVVEASSSQARVMNLGSFLEDVSMRYLAKTGDAIVDMPFLPRIAEGEIRLILSGRRVTHVVEKTPKGAVESGGHFTQSSCHEDSGGCNAGVDTFSANLGTGAKHVWHSPEAYPAVVEPFNENLEELLARMGLYRPPPLWTADFIRFGPKGETKFVLSEINANCVGFKSFPHLAHELVASVADSLLMKTST